MRASSRKAPLERRLALWLGFAGLLALLGSRALALSARWWWAGEIAANMRWQIGWGGLAAAGLLLAGRAWRAGALAGLLALWHLAPALMLWTGRPDCAGAGASFKLVSANLLVGNHALTEVRDWLRREAADVAVLNEVNCTWRDALLIARSEWPHQLCWPERIEECAENTFGLAVISRHPFTRTAIVPTPRGLDKPYMEVELSIDGHALHVVGVHALRAGGPWTWPRRQDSYSGLATRISWTPHSVLAGDFNATLYSPLFRDLCRTTGLADARAGFGRCPTWRTDRLIPGLEVDLDHVLAGSGLRVLSYATVPIPGSDHRAVVVELAIDGQAP